MHEKELRDYNTQHGFKTQVKKKATKSQKLNEKIERVIRALKKLRVSPGKAGLRCARFCSKFSPLKQDPDDDHQCAELYISLPSRRDYPDYYEFIQKPICLSSIQKKVRASVPVDFSVSVFPVRNPIQSIRLSGTAIG